MVCTQRPHELEIRGAADARHFGPLGLGQLYGEGADSAGRPVDEYGVARRDLRDIPHHFEINETFGVVGIASVAIPALMIWLSVTLPARANRITNLVIAALYIPFSAYNVVGESSWLYFYALSIGIELLLLAFILRSAWTWPRASAVPAGRATTDLRQSA